MSTLARRLAAEGLGTALLVAAVVGSGIHARNLAGDNTALALLWSLASGGAWWRCCWRSNRCRAAT